MVDLPIEEIHQDCRMKRHLPIHLGLATDQYQDVAFDDVEVSESGRRVEFIA